MPPLHQRGCPPRHGVALHPAADTASGNRRSRRCLRADYCGWRRFDWGANGADRRGATCSCPCSRPAPDAVLISANQMAVFDHQIVEIRLGPVGIERHPHDAAAAAFDDHAAIGVPWSLNTLLTSWTLRTLRCNAGRGQNRRPLSERRIGPPLSFHPGSWLQVVHFPILTFNSSRARVFSSASIRGFAPSRTDRLQRGPGEAASLKPKRSHSEVPALNNRSPGENRPVDLVQLFHALSPRFQDCRCPAGVHVVGLRAARGDRALQSTSPQDNKNARLDIAARVAAGEGFIAVVLGRRRAAKTLQEGLGAAGAVPARHSKLHTSFR